MRVALITFGSRGDTQPLVALGVALQAAGHQARLIAPARFADFAAEHGLEFAALPGDIDKMSKELVEVGGTNLYRNIKVIWEAAVPLGVEVFNCMEEACADVDAIVYTFLLAIPGHWLAQNLGIPEFFAHLIPMFTPTRHQRPPLFPPSPIMTEAYNVVTQQLFSTIFTQANLLTYRLVRRNHPYLPPPREMHFPVRRVPSLYAFSRYVLDTSDYPPDTFITGYWSLDAPDWSPPEDLRAFLDAGSPPVYVGFGSMVTDQMESFLHTCVGALRDAGQRGLILTGWGADAGLSFGDDMHVIGAAPHRWLFPRMGALVHHGGAGTTGASFLSGVPQVVVPYFGDQFLWGDRAARLGVAPDPIKRIDATQDALAMAIHTAATYEPMRRRAAELGERIRAEPGAQAAVRMIERAVAR